jgi:hypothetical protein
MTAPLMRVEFCPGEARIVDLSRQIKEGVVIGVDLEGKGIQKHEYQFLETC